MRLCALSLAHTESAQGDRRVSARLEFHWGDEVTAPGLLHFDEDEWSLLLALLVLGARAACVDMEIVQYEHSHIST